MKLSELRRTIEAYPEDRLRLILVEMYKALPKKLIEEKQIDPLIVNTNKTLEQRKITKQADNAPNFEMIKTETETFLHHAYQQHYFAPNREIHKKDRPKWRFIVKRLTEQLAAILHQEEHAAEASVLLEKLYKMLCYASGHYLFSSVEPFNSIRIPQSDYFRSVVASKAACQQPQVWIRESIELMVKQGTDQETLVDSLIEVLLEFLKTAPLKELAIEQCDRIIADWKAKGPSGRRSAYGSHSEYEYRDHLNQVHLIRFYCGIRLNEYDAAIREFKNSFRETANNPEVDLYILLQHLCQFDLPKLWVREYEAAIHGGVKPREALQRMYLYLTEHKQFPEHYYY